MLKISICNIGPHLQAMLPEIGCLTATALVDVASKNALIDVAATDTFCDDGPARFRKTYFFLAEAFKHDISRMA